VDDKTSVLVINLHTQEILSSVKAAEDALYILHQQRSARFFNFANHLEVSVLPIASFKKCFCEQ
jgi:hypothetical protein